MRCALAFSLCVEGLGLFFSKCGPALRAPVSVPLLPELPFGVVSVFLLSALDS